MNLADNLKRIRKENNLSQEQLAEKLGVSRQSVSKWESNLAYPELDKVMQICQIFNINTDELLNQNINETNEKKEAKANFNKFIDDFLNYITKTIDMFTSLKFKNKLKCLFEQVIIGTILLIIFLIIGYACKGLFLSIFSLLPEGIYKIRYGLYSVLSSIYIILSLILGIILLLHIFKVRYLDYFEIVDETFADNPTDEIKIEQTKQVTKKQKEKIIIRDSNISGYKFISGLLKFFIFILKFFALIAASLFCLSLITIVFTLVISFVIIKTGTIFIGIFLTLVSCIVINLIILDVIYSFIANKKSKKKNGLAFICSLIFIGVGFALITLGITKIEYINDIDNSDYYITTEEVIDMNKSLVFTDYYNMIDINYIASNNSNIKIEYKHSKYYDLVLNQDKENNFNVISISNSLNADDLKLVKAYVNDLKNLKVIDYNQTEVNIYTTQENIDKLKENLSNYYNENQTVEDVINEYENKINDIETAYESKINELEDKLYNCQD